MVVYVRRIVTGISDGKEDVKDTFTAGASSTVNEDIIPPSGEVWLISVFAKITQYGSTSDTLNIYFYDGTTTHLVDTDTGSTAQVFLKSAMISSNAYVRIQIQTDSVGGTRTITYWYQVVKLS